MKLTLFLSAFWLFIAGLFSSPNGIVSGTVTGKTGEALIGAKVSLYQHRVLVKGAIADINGKYQLEAAPGIYELEINYTGFNSKRLTDIILEAGKTNTINVVLEEATSLSEVVIVSHESSRSPREKDTGAMRATAPTERPAPSGMLKKMKPKAPVSAPAAESREFKAEPAVYKPTSGEVPAVAPIKAPAELADDIVIVDGRKKRVVVPFDPETYEEKVMLIDVEDGSIYTGTEVPEKESPGTIAQPSPKAGLLTAGEWNDLHNWNRHWVDLLKDGEIESYEKMYGFYPSKRYSILVRNENDYPLADVVVQLKNGGEIIWEARTDNTGKAELWAGLTDNKTYASLGIETWVNGNKQRVNNPKTAEEGFNIVRVKAECYAPTNVDIVWAVDATGSMGDEIEYLKTELLDVINRAKNNNPALQFRMGTAFYRDKGDDYIVKSSGLSPDIQQTVEFIQKQYAGGGGDYPEAVHSALEEVVYGQKWSANAVARICFLVLDASPHQEPEVIASLQKNIREAARLGIRIVPITASGIQKDTEFLMKFFGLATNGSYVFLTDHSGIGGKHLEPTTDEYKVELLNDLLVRIITEYTSIQTCEGKSNIRFENDPQQQPGAVLQASYYPNPANDLFTLDLPVAVQSVSIYDAEGKGVLKVEKPAAGPNQIRVADLMPGFYTIRIQNNGRMQSGKLMVMR